MEPTGPDSPVDATNQALDRWVADAEAMAQRYQQLATNVEQVAVTETTPDNMVTVTVNSTGVVTDLRIHERATTTMNSARIAEAVLWAMRKAQSRISGRVAEVMKSTLGDSDPTLEQTVLDRYQDTFPAPFEPQAQARPDAVEEQRIGHDDTPAQQPAAAPIRPPARTPARRAASADDWDGGESFLEEVDR